MAVDPIASRYARAAFESAQGAGKTDELLEQLSRIGQLIQGHAELRRLIINPDVDPPDKVGVLDRAMQGAWSPLTRAFIEMVVVRGRAEYLPQIADAFEAAVDAAQGRLRAQVRSAHPVGHETLARIRKHLEAREGKHIDLEADVDPRLIGGVQLVLGHRVIDGSIRRQLAELRERLLSVRVF